MTSLWFSALAQLPGNPTPDQMLAQLLRRTAGEVPVPILTTAVRPRLIPVPDDSGMEHL